MEKINTEKKVQLLKDLAANVGYKLIAAPFDTPFVEDSFEILPFDEECKQVFWTVPESVLCSKEHEELRKMLINADVIDSVCVTSILWPSEKEDRVAILLIDLTRKRRGSIKFVDSSKWDISEEDEMAAVCDMLIHDVFPGEDFLAFGLDEDTMDLELDFTWNEQVCVVPSDNLLGSHKYSLLPLSHMPKPVAKLGFKYARLDGLFYIEDFQINIEAKAAGEEKSHVDNPASEKNMKYSELPDFRDYIDYDDHIEMVEPAIVVSANGDLQPRLAIPKTDSAIVDMPDFLILTPKNKKLDLNYLLEQLGKENTLRQLPFRPYPGGKIEWKDLNGVLVEVPETWEIHRW